MKKDTPSLIPDSPVSNPKPAQENKENDSYVPISESYDSILKNENVTIKKRVKLRTEDDTFSSSKKNEKEKKSIESENDDDLSLKNVADEKKNSYKSQNDDDSSSSSTRNVTNKKKKSYNDDDSSNEKNKNVTKKKRKKSENEDDSSSSKKKYKKKKEVEPRKIISKKEKILHFISKDQFQICYPDQKPFKSRKHAVECLVPYHLFGQLEDDYEIEKIIQENINLIENDTKNNLISSGQGKNINLDKNADNLLNADINANIDFIENDKNNGGLEDENKENELIKSDQNKIKDLKEYDQNKITEIISADKIKEQDFVHAGETKDNTNLLDENFLKRLYANLIFESDENIVFDILKTEEVKYLLYKMRKKSELSKRDKFIIKMGVLKGDKIRMKIDREKYERM